MTVAWEVPRVTFTRIEARPSALGLQHRPSLAWVESLRARCSGGEGVPGDCAIRQRRESAGVPAHSSCLLQHRWPRVLCTHEMCAKPFGRLAKKVVFLTPFQTQFLREWPSASTHRSVGRMAIISILNVLHVEKPAPLRALPRANF